MLRTAASDVATAPSFNSKPGLNNVYHTSSISPVAMPTSSTLGLCRRDRKKNARFDIPPERSLQNIDQLILESTNDEEVKELKQHKRLLRNRQAALDTRYRKKKHTEELEEEKKLYVERKRELEDEKKKLQMQLKNLTIEYEELLLQNSQLSQEVEALKLERERLVEKQSDPSTTILPSQPPIEFSELTLDIENWDEFVMVDDFAMDSNQQMQMLSVT
ncbi:hypothetical protein K432DRAFT_408789 [Lepidopterella palustris CBS 459.81]|uniref:BZIP domain-containing protein n=1 Tax=Lepidopterella palustris CBS 459.81 TaxID=1314670 RepID=A0A8E2E1L5_9PEZI|nr:hypothetical protein K432DRAFT_408789 [Lepidopterella palustris CBS 459.81]